MLIGDVQFHKEKIVGYIQSLTCQSTWCMYKRCRSIVIQIVAGFENAASESWRCSTYDKCFFRCIIGNPVAGLNRQFGHVGIFFSHININGCRYGIFENENVHDYLCIEYTYTYIFKLCKWKTVSYVVSVVLHFLFDMRKFVKMKVKMGTVSLGLSR